MSSSDTHQPLPETNLTGNDCDVSRLVLQLEYAGTSFCGSQRQNNGITIQQALEEALSDLGIKTLKRPLFSGRTDSGVHSQGQVVHVDCIEESLNRIKDVRTALNAKLPETIAVKQVTINEDKTFHAILSAQWRWYQYRIYNQPSRSVWTGGNALWFRYPLDVAKMNTAAQLLLGEQDVESFKCPKTATTNNICQIKCSEVYHEGDYILYNIVANRFVYKMIRNIVGTLLEIGAKPEKKPDEMTFILNQKNRQSASSTAKSSGLTLMAVYYPPPWDFFQKDVCVKTLTQVVQESSDNENLLRKAS